MVAAMLTDRDREHAITFTFDFRHRLINADITSIGTADQTFMRPREILRDALGHNASAIAVVHNHPSR